MPKVKFLPENKEFEVEKGKTILEVALENGIHLEHACGGNCACTTCHIIVREGMDHLSEMEDEEADRMDTATGITLHSRLGCQCRVQGDVVVEIPKHNVNIVSESELLEKNTD